MRAGDASARAGPSGGTRERARPRRIVLHMGTHKTGSTTLQRTLARHRMALIRSGTRYIGGGQALPGLHSAFLDDPMRFEFNRLSGLPVERIREIDAARMATLADKLAQVKAPVVILSNEYLAMLEPQEMARLRDFLSRFGEVHAVYYYRELHDWISSDSQQMAKEGFSAGPTRFEVGLARIHGFPLKIAGVFGARAHFLKFEEAVRTGICDSLLAHFQRPTLRALGLDERVENRSISQAAVEALFAYNEEHPRGSPGHCRDKAAALSALPGPKYRAPPFSARQIALYAARRAEVAGTLGMRLAPPDALPRQPGPVRRRLHWLLRRVPVRLRTG